MYIHPIEAVLYYGILFAPAFLGVPLHYSSMLAYIVFAGITGVLDHSGIRMKLLFGLYNSVDHDLHHQYKIVNFGFPFVWLDVLFGTYKASVVERINS